MSDEEDKVETEDFTKFCGHTMWHEDHHIFTIGRTRFVCPGYDGVQLEDGRPVGWVK